MSIKKMDKDLLIELLKKDVSFKDKEIDRLEEENKKLKEQLEYLISNEYLNQVKWERNFNEDLVKELQQRIDEAIKYLEHEQFKRIILGFGRDKYLNAIKDKTIKMLKGKGK